MSLQPPVITTPVLAAQKADRIIQALTQAHQLIRMMRADASATEATQNVDPRTGETVHVPALPVCTRADVDAALGADNVTIVDSVERLLA